jgi:hypothetical protein
MMKGARGLAAVRLGPGGIQKAVNLGFRADEELAAHVDDFVRLARGGRLPARR